MVLTIFSETFLAKNKTSTIVSITNKNYNALKDILFFLTLFAPSEKGHFIPQSQLILNWNQNKTTNTEGNVFAPCFLPRGNNQ